MLPAYFHYSPDLSRVSVTSVLKDVAVDTVTVILRDFSLLLDTSASNEEVLTPGPSLANRVMGGVIKVH